jgi:hypothetical protein
LSAVLSADRLRIDDAFRGFFSSCQQLCQQTKDTLSEIGFATLEGWRKQSKLSMNMGSFDHWRTQGSQTDSMFG